VVVGFLDSICLHKVWHNLGGNRSMSLVQTATRILKDVPRYSENDIPGSERVEIAKIYNRSLELGRHASHYSTQGRRMRLIILFPA
jgi:hypothetical protein